MGAMCYVLGPYILWSPVNALKIDSTKPDEYGSLETVANKVIY